MLKKIATNSRIFILKDCKKIIREFVAEKNFAFKFYSNSKTKADFGSKVISEAKSNVFPEITSFPDL